MGLFDSQSLKTNLLGAATSLFNQYSPVQLAPAGTKPVQATLPATNNGTPAQDPIVQNGLRTTNVNGTMGLFGGVNPLYLIVGSIVVVAAIVMIARR